MKPSLSRLLASVRPRGSRTAKVGPAVVCLVDQALAPNASKDVQRALRVELDRFVQAFWTWARPRADDNGHVDWGSLAIWGRQQGLPFVAAGSERATFRVREGVVLKLPLYREATHANRVEARVWAQAPADVRRHLVPVLAASPSGKWLLMEEIEDTDLGGKRLDRGMKKQLASFGIQDLFETNLSNDGRIFDYGWVDLGVWEQATGRPLLSSRGSRATAPASIRVLRQVPEADVLAHWRALYLEGKHKGHTTTTPDKVYEGKSSVWVEVEIPHDLTNADWNADPEAELSPAQEARARRYAASTGTFPPGMASYKGVKGSKRAYVSDGNHRAYASFLRGDPVARFYMPLPDFERFAAVHPDRLAPRGSARR